MASKKKRAKGAAKPAAKKRTSPAKRKASSGAKTARAKPILESRVSFITIGVRDFLASLAFYRDSLGFKLHMLQGDIAMFDLGGAVLALYPLKLLAEDAGLRPGQGFGGIALAHNVRNKKDVDRVMNAAAERGARILVPAEDKFWGGRSGYFADPDGYPWEVAWNPGIRMDARGRLILKPAE
jgi:catechol 2,3-dioxygenase-like lactoylglutathione lyase family enzyme